MPRETFWPGGLASPRSQPPCAPFRFHTLPNHSTSVKGLDWVFREAEDRGRGGRTGAEIWGKPGSRARTSPEVPRTRCIPGPLPRGRPYSPPVFTLPNTPLLVHQTEVAGQAHAMPQGGSQGGCRAVPARVAFRGYGERRAGLARSLLLQLPGGGGAPGPGDPPSPAVARCAPPPPRPAPTDPEGDRGADRRRPRGGIGETAGCRCRRPTSSG